MQTLTQKTIFLNTEVAISYKTSKQNINSTKNYHADELIENIHYFYDYEQTKGGRQRAIKWTLEGVYKLFDKIKKLKERSKMTNIKDIKKIKITCKECKSEFSMFIGHSLYVCPICGNNFGINQLNDPFFRIKQAFECFTNPKNCDIELVCEIKE